MHALSAEAGWLAGVLAFSTPATSNAQIALSLVFGVMVGFALGLTGGGGSIFAVPLLIYGLGVPAGEAPAASLAAVGATAAFGLVRRLRTGEVEFLTGLIFSVGGILGTPIGAALGRQLHPTALLLGFAGLMVIVAVRMWRNASGRSATGVGEERALVEPLPADCAGPTCHRDPEGKLRLTSRCSLLLAIVGLGAGVLAGLFGVGGGFVIVPALVFFSGMGIHRAVATSLLAITLISASGVASNAWVGRVPEMGLTLAFVGGGILGMELGTWLGRRLSGPRLQRLFAVAILIVAAYVALRNLGG